MVRIVVYDPRSLAAVWVMDEATGEYIAVPYRVPHPDMTLAESDEARRRLLALKAADRTERRLFDNLTTIRAIEEQAKTTTARRKAERTRQARQGAHEAALLRASAPSTPLAGIVKHDRPEAAESPPCSASIQPFTDVEVL